MKRIDQDQIVRNDIREMEPYIPILPFDILSQRLGLPVDKITKLDANENPYGPPPQAIQALSEEQWYHIYPDPEANALRDSLSQRLNLPKDKLFAGMGADELIDLVLRVILEPGEAVINCPPSFGMYPFSTAVNNGRTINVPRNPDFTIDLPGIMAILESATAVKAIFLCSPNNPDGSMISDQDLAEILSLPLLVILDEAYIDFAAVNGYKSRMDWALEYDNLAVLRTFSKLAGLAGLRIGYGIFPDWLLPHMWKIKQPYNVNVAASRMALSALSEPVWMDEKVTLLVLEKDRMVQELAQFDFLRPYPSYSNFVLFQVTDRPAAQLKEQLAANGVLVRYFNKPGLDNCIRISAGRPEDTKQLLAAMKACV